MRRGLAGHTADRAEFAADVIGTVASMVAALDAAGEGRGRPGTCGHAAGGSRLLVAVELGAAVQRWKRLSRRRLRTRRTGRGPHPTDRVGTRPRRGRTATNRVLRPARRVVDRGARARPLDLRPREEEVDVS